MRNDEIYKLLEAQGESFDLKLESMNKTVRYGLKGVRQYIDAGFEAIDKADKIRNDRIESNTDEIEIIRKETWFFRLVQRNPIPSAVALLIIIMIGAFGYHRINIKRTFENLTKIELNDDVQ